LSSSFYGGQFFTIYNVRKMEGKKKLIWIKKRPTETYLKE